MSGFLDTGGTEARRAGIRRVREWTVACLGREADGAEVFVAELACAEPGCPPRETVVVVTRAGVRERRTVHAAAADVTREQVAAALAARGDHEHHGGDR